MGWNVYMVWKCNWNIKLCYYFYDNIYYSNGYIGSIIICNRISCKDI